MSDIYDLLVVGGGPAGYVGAIRGAQLGKKVACIERERAGGICLNWGCIPTKSLLRNAELFQLVKHRASDFGLTFSDLSYDWSKIISRSRKVSDQLAGGVEYLFKKNKVEYVLGEGSFTAPDTLSVKLKDGKSRLLQGRKVLVSTGVRPRSLPGLEFNGNTAISSREAMVLKQRPASIVIIGAGAIGVEFAYFFNAFGTQVTLVEMLPQILPVEDEEVSETLLRSFTKQGIRVLTNTKVEKGEVSPDGIKVTLAGSKSEIVQAEIALVAIGVSSLLPAGLSFELERGFIEVNDSYQTSVKDVYGAGDVIGPPWLAHVAFYEATQAVEGMFTDHKPRRVTTFPSCTYCQPQVASVGMAEKAAKASGPK